MGKEQAHGHAIQISCFALNCLSENFLNNNAYLFGFLSLSIELAGIKGYWSIIKQQIYV